MISFYPNTTHRPSWPRLRWTSIFQSVVLTQPRQGFLEGLGAHIASWNRMPRWNEGWRGHQRSTSWGQISHYLPHKPSWCKAKVRQAGGHSWVQRLNHPSGKWPAFDQACHFCHKGDPRDQTTSSIRACGCGSKWWLTSLFSLCQPSQVKLQEIFIVGPCQPHNIRSYPERDLLFLCLTKACFTASSPLPYPNLCFMRAHHRDRLKKLNDRASKEEQGHSRQKQSSSASHINGAPCSRLASIPWSHVPQSPLLLGLLFFAFSTIGKQTDTQVN